MYVAVDTAIRNETLKKAEREKTERGWSKGWDSSVPIAMALGAFIGPNIEFQLDVAAQKWLDSVSMCCLVLNSQCSTCCLAGSQQQMQQVVPGSQ